MGASSSFFEERLIDMFHRRFLEARAKGARRERSSLPLSRAAQCRPPGLGNLVRSGKGADPRPAACRETTDQKLETTPAEGRRARSGGESAQRKQELAEEAAAEKARRRPRHRRYQRLHHPVSRRNYLLKIGADLQLDNRTYLGTGAGRPSIRWLHAAYGPPSPAPSTTTSTSCSPDFGQGTPPSTTPTPSSTIFRGPTYASANSNARRLERLPIRR